MLLYSENTENNSELKMNHGRDDNAVSTVHRNGGVKKENKKGKKRKKASLKFKVHL